MWLEFAQSTDYFFESGEGLDSNGYIIRKGYYVEVEELLRLQQVVQVNCEKEWGETGSLGNSSLLVEEVVGVEEYFLGQEKSSQKRHLPFVFNPALEDFEEQGPVNLVKCCFKVNEKYGYTGFASSL